jgi:hypothetical protein
VRGSAERAGSLRATALILRLLVAAEIILDIALMPALLHQRSTVLGLPDGTSSPAEVRDADRLVAVLSRISFGVVVLIAVVFLVWFYRARLNVENYEPRFQRWSVGWAAGGWLPVVNLWVPYQITTDILLDSDQPLTGPARAARRTYGLLQAWWTLWLIRLALTVATRTAHKDTPERFAAYDVIQLAYQAGDLIAAVLLVLVVDAVTRAQRRRREEAA